jgi:hypothetical protein
LGDAEAINLGSIVMIFFWSAKRLLAPQKFDSSESV